MLQELGGSAMAKKEAGKNEMRALGVAGEHWSVEATLRRVVACAVRATATRGRRGTPRGARTLTPVGHCAERFSLFRLVP